MRAALMSTLAFLVGVWIGSLGISEALLTCAENQDLYVFRESSVTPCENAGKLHSEPEADITHGRIGDLRGRSLWLPLWAPAHHRMIQQFNGYLMPSLAHTYEAGRSQSPACPEAVPSSVGTTHGASFGHDKKEVDSLRVLAFITGKRRSTNDLTLLQQLHSIAKDLGLDPELAIGMAKVESNFDHKAVSPKGAIGVLQVMPQFACKDFEITKEMLFDPDVNIRIGLSYMKGYMERFDEDLDLSLAAYNAGASRVVRAGFAVPPIQETQQYVKRVKQAIKHLKEAQRQS